MTDQTQNEPKTFDEGYVKELRQESANYRVKLREAEARLEQIGEKQNELKRKEYALEAKALGAVDTDTLLRLIDMDSETDKTPHEVVSELLESKPFLKGGSIGKASNPASGNGEAKIFTRQDLDGMTQAEINRHWDAISDQMTRGLIR